MLTPTEPTSPVQENASVEENSAPAFRVFSAVPRRGDTDEWFEIGTAHLQPGGRGLVVVLHAQPLNGTLVLRAFSDDPAEKPKLSLAQQVEAFERALIEQSLMEARGKITVVMEQLDIPRRTLSEKMTRLGIDRRRFVAAPSRSVKPRAADRSQVQPDSAERGSV